MRALVTGLAFAALAGSALAQPRPAPMDLARAARTGERPPATHGFGFHDREGRFGRGYGGFHHTFGRGGFGLGYGGFGWPYGYGGYGGYGTGDGAGPVVQRQEAYGPGFDGVGPYGPPGPPAPYAPRLARARYDGLGRGVYSYGYPGYAPTPSLDVSAPAYYAP